jgi:hypothetical protein
VAVIKAAGTHSIQGTTWALLKADSERVETLRAVLDAARQRRWSGASSMRVLTLAA